MKNIKELIVLGRFHFIFGGLLLYSLGYLLAVSSGISLSMDRFLWGYAILFFAHLSVSYSNDFFDAEEDRLSKPTLFSGGSGILVKHPELARTARNIAISLIALSFITAIGFIYYYQFSSLLLLYVLIGIICGWFYSAPPLRFSHRLYGNIIFALTICILVPGFGNYIASGTITSEMWAFALPLVFYGYAFTIGVQIPDINADRINKKNNYASTFGEKASYRAITVLCILATLAIYSITYLFSLDLNFTAILIFSFFPLSASIFGLAVKRLDTEKRIMAIISSIFLFTALCDAYLILSYV
jgi:1,4-dihydroxy-2-naphthoate polyprenyltransferase